MAAAYTTLIAYMILALMQGVVSTRVHRKIVGDEKTTVYDMKYIYMLAVVTIVLCTSCILLYQHTILRYCIIAVLIVLAVVFRNKILMLFQEKIKNSLHLQRKEAKYSGKRCLIQVE